MSNKPLSKGDQALARLRRMRQDKDRVANNRNPRARLYGTDALVEIFKTPNPNSTTIAKWVLSWQTKADQPSMLLSLNDKDPGSVKKECIALLDEMQVNKLFYTFNYKTVNDVLMLCITFYHEEDYVIFKMTYDG